MTRHKTKFIKKVYLMPSFGVRLNTLEELMAWGKARISGRLIKWEVEVHLAKVENHRVTNQMDYQGAGSLTYAPTTDSLTFRYKSFVHSEVRIPAPNNTYNWKLNS